MSLGSADIIFNPGSPAQAEVVSVDPPAIFAGGSQTAAVAVQIQDKYGNSVGAGVTPVVTTTLGTILTAGGSTDANGVVTHTLQSTMLGEAAIYVDGVAASGPTIPFIPGPPGSAHITATDTVLVVGGETVPLIFDVRDEWGNAVTNTTLITPTLTPSHFGKLCG